MAFFEPSITFTGGDDEKKPQATQKEINKYNDLVDKRKKAANKGNEAKFDKLGNQLTTMSNQYDFKWDTGPSGQRNGYAWPYQNKKSR